MIGQSTKLTPDIVNARMMRTAVKHFPVTSPAFDPATKVSYPS